MKLKLKTKFEKRKAEILDRIRGDRRFVGPEVVAERRTKRRLTQSCGCDWGPVLERSDRRIRPLEPWEGEGCHLVLHLQGLQRQGKISLF